jgi:hypothetical protein
MTTTTVREQWMYERAEKIIKGKVCSYCGGKLSALETVDNSGNPDVWPGCNRCSKFDYGVSPEDYELAKRLFFEAEYMPYDYLCEDMHKQRDNEDWSRYYFQCQLGGMSRIVNFIKKEISNAKQAAYEAGVKSNNKGCGE